MSGHFSDQQIHTGNAAQAVRQQKDRRFQLIDLAFDKPSDAFAVGLIKQYREVENRDVSPEAGAPYPTCREKGKIKKSVYSKRSACIMPIRDR
ncbi:MAG TPA: hypothetical protein PLD20_26790 [Blastocatellia bacterium]|nr:hypothetical protein [Blastocatellia bacterium]HMV83914.1 hypothetical protein [Blastocatellia bacterium]HMZ21570.1 hypothetical protein [Blastocatellia bacterium]HNG28593.1 hypothetical protein [Blastocatellia bacterium]